MIGQIKRRWSGRWGERERRRKWKRDRTQRGGRRRKQSRSTWPREVLSCGRWQCSSRSSQSRCTACNHINCVVFSLPGHIWEGIYCNTPLILLMIAGCVTIPNHLFMKALLFLAVLPLQIIPTIAAGNPGSGMVYPSLRSRDWASV